MAEIPAEHSIDADSVYKKVLKGEPITCAEANELGRAHGIWIAATAQGQEGIALSPIQKEVTSTSARIDAVQNHERAEADQLARIERAVDRAKEMGIVREEVFNTSKPKCRTAYLLSSSHYGNDDYDPNSTPEDTKQSQVQLFQLAHLLELEEVESPLFVEGRQHGRGYTPFPVMRPTIEFGGNSYDIHTPEAQQFLFDHPDELISCMDAQQPIARKYKCSTPCFYSYTTYKGISGAHSVKTAKLVTEFGETWEPWMKQYKDKYKEFWSQFPAGQDEPTKYRVETGWGEPPQRIPVVRLAGSLWWPLDHVLSEMHWYLTYADKLAELDEAREKDMCEFFIATKPECVPMGFAGKGHEFRLIDRLKDGMNVRVLTPTASIEFDNTRTKLPVNHPDAKMLNIKAVTDLIEALNKVPQQPPKQS